MPFDPLASAGAVAQAADKQAETAARGANDSAFLPSTQNLTSPQTGQSFLTQAGSQFQESFKGSGITGAFENVRKTGAKAAQALDIVDQKYTDVEHKKIEPSVTALTDEVTRLQSQRLRVLPDILADDTIVDFRSKMRISSKIKGMLDGEINKLLAKKKGLETGADNRAKTVVDTLRAQADIINKEFEADKFELSERVDLWQNGQASLQDMLEFAANMDQKARDRASKGKDNIFIGKPSRAMIVLFKEYEATGTVPVNSTASAQQRAEFLVSYERWDAEGREGEHEIVGFKDLPFGVSGPKTPVTREVGSIFQTLEDEKDKKAESVQNQFLENLIKTQAMLIEAGEIKPPKKR